MSEKKDNTSFKPIRGARVLLMEFIYQSCIGAGGAADSTKIIEEIASDDKNQNPKKVDLDYFREKANAIVPLISKQELVLVSELEFVLAKHIDDRDMADVTDVEKSILFLGAFELMHALEVPFKVVISEAVTLAETYGGTGTAGFINSALDSLAKEVRDVEYQAEHE